MANTLQTKPTLSRAGKTVRDIFESGRPIAYIHSPEEQRIARLLLEAGQDFAGLQRLPIWVWTLTEGMRPEGGIAVPGSESPRSVLDFIVEHPEPAIFHLKDFHEPMGESAEVRRRLRDVYDACTERNKFVVITSPVHAIPDELDRIILYLQLRTPDLVELAGFLREEVERLAPGEYTDLPDDTVNMLAQCLMGLTLDEAGYALRRALASGIKLGPDVMSSLLQEKRLLINRTGYIESIAESIDLDAIGGLTGLKKWLLERRKLFQMRDSISSEIVPKGLLMMGIPGCGKSLTVKAIAASFHLPLYRIDMVEIFSGRHGKPEGVFVKACKMMEDMAPAVLWFDEIEMGINSADSGGEQGRIFAFFLTWMQEKVRGLFVAATANRIDLLPAEMIRKGRFDEVFFVDLPIESERKDIFRIHMLHRGLDPDKYNIAQLMEFTVGWTGAEIEQCVVSALTEARMEDRDVTERDLITICARTVPLSRTMKEQINRIRSWAFERALRASPDPNAY